MLAVVFLDGGDVSNRRWRLSRLLQRSLGARSAVEKSVVKLFLARFRTQGRLEDQRRVSGGGGARRARAAAAAKEDQKVERVKGNKPTERSERRRDANIF
jgi:hypothetical protein